MKKLRKLFITLLIFVFALVITKVTVSAENGSSVRTYTLSSNGTMIPTQDAYIAVKKVTSMSFTNSETLNLSSPDDIYYNSSLRMFYIRLW